MATKRHLLAVLGLLYSLLLTGTAGSEPLRLLIPEFIGPAPLSKHVRTTIYLEIVKAFRPVDAPDKGAWILYGQEKLPHPNHDAVLAATRWPSVRADIAIWGQVHQYGDGVVVQPYLTLTPLIKKRQVRPELWTLKIEDGSGQSTQLELDIPGQFYQFEPLSLTSGDIIAFDSPLGMPIYSARKGGTTKGSLGEVIHVYEIHDDAILVSSDGLKGWVRTRPSTWQHSEAIDFSKGMVRLLRGDWRGARQSFASVLKNANLPQNLRIHSLIYTGLAKEKTGFSGHEEFTSAYVINRLDKAAASYLLMSQAAEIQRLLRSETVIHLPTAQHNLQATLNATKMLFAEKDPWLAKIRLLLKPYNE